MRCGSIAFLPSPDNVANVIKANLIDRSTYVSLQPFERLVELECEWRDIVPGPGYDIGLVLPTSLKTLKLFECVALEMDILESFLSTDLSHSIVEMFLDHPIYELLDELAERRGIKLLQAGVDWTYEPSNINPVV